jgi:hypothetical protein
MKPRGLFLGGLLLALMVGVVGAQDKGEAQDSPKAVFQTARAAMKKGEVKAFMTYLTEDSRALMTGQLIMVGMAIRADAALDPSGKAAELVKPVNEVFKKHGLTAEALAKITIPLDPAGQANARREMARLVKSPSAFCADLLAAIAKANSKSGPAVFGHADLTDVNIKGNKATGTLVYAEKKTKAPLQFARVGDRWFLVLPDPAVTAPAVPVPSKK